MSKNLNNGQVAFTNQLNLFVTAIVEAKKTENPAMHLHTNGVRTIVFKLEALARLYKNIHNKKRFAKMYDLFKRMEDSLGAIDMHLGMQKELSIWVDLNVNEQKIIEENIADSVDALNTYISGNYLNDVLDIDRIREKLETAKWANDVIEVNTIKNAYINEAIKLIDWYKENVPFTELENQVHELRRKLRWLSIYPQALNGKMQLVNSTAAIKHLEKYITDAVVNSPFNTMPATLKDVTVYNINKQSFYALSWVIAELGLIKDEGLLITYLAELIQKDTNVNTETALQQSATMLQAPNGVHGLLQYANTIATHFFADKVLNTLVKS